MGTRGIRGRAGRKSESERERGREGKRALYITSIDARISYDYGSL